ncbi:hypothetical protein C0J52_01837 [Blattella germanica]|nr:hypothetical protein C0J52_01837 [Blattella germanica]
MFSLSANSRNLSTHFVRNKANHIPFKWAVVLSKNCSCVCSRFVPFFYKEDRDQNIVRRPKYANHAYFQNCQKIPVLLHSTSSHKSSIKDDTKFVNRKVGTLAATFVNNSSSALQPYMKLMRIDKPIGSWLLFWPCGWSIAMSASPGCLPDLSMLALFGVGAFIMRGAGCTINDMSSHYLPAHEKGYTLATVYLRNDIQLGCTSWLCEQTWPYYMSVGLVAAHLANQLFTLNINNPTDCSSKFVSNQRVGLILFAGIVMGSLFKTKEKEKKTIRENVTVEHES